MKKLNPVTVGGYAINIGVEHVGGSRLAIVATNGTETLRHIVNHKGAHDMKQEDFETSIAKQIETVARELAGKIHSSNLVKSFTEMDIADKP